jgi:muconolactone delta-isomerase
MPLRVWRTDEITPLSPHPNDPAGQTEQSGSPAPQGGGSEFLTTFTVTIPAGTPRETVDATTAREAESARELAGQGHLLRLWMLPGEGRALGLWRARDADEMQTILASLPLDAWTKRCPITPARSARSASSKTAIR